MRSTPSVRYKVSSFHPPSLGRDQDERPWANAEDLTNDVLTAPRQLTPPPLTRTQQCYIPSSMTRIMRGNECEYMRWNLVDTTGGTVTYIPGTFFSLLSGIVPNALQPRGSLAISAESRTAPLIITPCFFCLFLAREIIHLLQSRKEQRHAQNRGCTCNRHQCLGTVQRLYVLSAESRTAPLIITPCFVVSAREIIHFLQSQRNRDVQQTRGVRAIRH